MAKSTEILSEDKNVLLIFHTPETFLHIIFNVEKAPFSRVAILSHFFRSKGFRNGNPRFKFACDIFIGQHPKSEVIACFTMMEFSNLENSLLPTYANGLVKGMRKTKNQVKC